MSTLATSYDLRAFCGPILDQGPIGSCFENAAVSAIDLMMRETGHAIAPLSRLDLYATVRQAQGTFNSDSGTVPLIGLEQLKNKGVANESSWSYDQNLLYVKPTDKVNAEAATQKITGYSVLDQYVSWTGFRDEIKHSLSEGKPVLLDFRDRTYFDNENSPISAQLNFSATDSSRGAHEVLIVGADDNLGPYGAYIVKNSWGAGWGDHGYGTISYMQGRADIGDIQELDSITGFKGIDLGYTQQRTQAAELYACLLGRSPEHSGIEYWSQLLGSGTSFSNAAQGIFQSSEARLLFPAAESNMQIVDTLYQQILGRVADKDGETYWSHFLDTGYSVGDISTALINYIANYNGNDSGTKASHDLLANKINMAMCYGVAFQADDYHRGEAIESLLHITSDANSVEAAKIGVAHDLGYF